MNAKTFDHFYYLMRLLLFFVTLGASGDNQLLRISARCCGSRLSVVVVIANNQLWVCWDSA